MEWGHVYGKNWQALNLSYHQTIFAANHKTRTCDGECRILDQSSLLIDLAGFLVGGQSLEQERVAVIAYN